MKLFIFIFMLTHLEISLAQSSDKAFRLEPLYGVETALVRYPEPPRYVTRGMYGLRALYGAPLLSGELELTRSQSRQDYPADNMVVRDRVDRVNMGIRSTLNFGSWLSFYARGGGSFAQGMSVVTQNGAEKTNLIPTTLQPYAGAGALISMASIFSLNAGITLIRNDPQHYDTQYTLGLNAHFEN